MKKLLFILLLFFSTTFLYSQAKPESYNSQFAAGQLLKQFSKQYYTGLALVAGGYTFAIVGAINNNAGVSTAGSLIALGGMVYQLASFSKIGQAGEHLMISSSRIGMTGKPMNTVGIKFNLGKKKSRYLALE